MREVFEVNYLIYPLKIMNITAKDSESSHRTHNSSKTKDYPFDDNGGSNKKDAYFYGPCDEVVVKKIYGIGKRAGNTIWLESTSMVITPTFKDYVTIMITHPNDADFKNIKIGQKFKRYEKIILEGDDGKATGYHFHISVGRGKMQGTGWVENENGSWVIKTTEGAVKAEEAFFIDPNFTTVKDTRGIDFVYLNEKEETKEKKKYVTTSLNLRVGPGTQYKIINSLPKDTEVTIYEEVDSWSRISFNAWVSSKYLEEKMPKVIYPTKKTTATSLNVREKPNGKILKVKAPLPKNTIVAIMKTSGNWTKINENRWVYSKYLS